MADEDSVPDSAVLLRFVPTSPQFLPSGHQTPTGVAFRVTEKDDEEAATRGCPPRVSVWDMGRTTLEQARAIRGGSGKNKPYALPAAAVAKIRVDLKHEPLRVVRDVTPDLLAHPGGLGHCGLEGLDKKSIPNGLARKNLQQALAESTTPLDE